MQTGILKNPDVDAGPVALVGPSLGKTFSKMAKKIKKSVKEGAFCHGEINYKYVKQQIKAHPYLLFSYDEDGDLVGFAVLAPHDATTLQVVILCTLPGVVGVGRYLIEKIDAIAAAAGVKKLILLSVTDSMAFYQHMGYELNLDTPLGIGEVKNDENINSDNENAGVDSVPMSKKIGGRQKMSRGSRKTRKRRTNK
jgi:hypothetical protein